MKISLKRAFVLEKAAQMQSSEIKIDTELTLSIYSPNLAADDTAKLQAEVDAARAKMLERHALSLDLITAAYRIRGLLGVANMQHGISELLTTQKLLAKEETRLTASLRAFGDREGGEAGITVAVAKAKALRATAPGERYLGREDTVDIPLFAPEHLDGMRKRLKQIAMQRLGINETLTVKNVGNTISLDEETVRTLRRADLLAEA